MTNIFTYKPIYLHEIEEKTNLKLDKQPVVSGSPDYFVQIRDSNTNHIIGNVSSVFGTFREGDDKWANSNEVVEISFTSNDINNLTKTERDALQQLINNLDMIFIDYDEYDKCYFREDGIFKDLNYGNNEEEENHWIDWMRKRGFVNQVKLRQEKIDKLTNE